MLMDMNPKNLYKEEICAATLPSLNWFRHRGSVPVETIEMI